jgi:HEAT repeat protein
VSDSTKITMPVMLDSLIGERNHRKKAQEWEARLRELEHASLEELCEAIQDDKVLMRQKYDRIPLRRKAIQLLAARADASVVPHLLPLLHDDMPDIRLEAIAALGALGDARAIDALKRVVRAPLSEAIFEAANAALLQLGVTPAEITPDKPEPALEELPAPDAPLPHLLRLLHHADWRIRKHAVGVLGDRRDPAARKALLDCLRDPDWEVRVHTMRALQNIRNQAVTQALVAMIRDNTPVVSTAAAQLTESLGLEALEPLAALLGVGDITAREHAVRLLRKLRDPQVIEPLLRALRDSDDQVRHLAAEALLEIGPPVFDALAHATDHPNSDARWKAVDAMARLRDERLIPALIAALRDHEADIREIAARALQALNWEPHTPTEQMADAIARWAWDQLPPFGAQAVPLLLRLANERNVRIRRYIHDTLAQACGQVKIVGFGRLDMESFDPKTTVVNLDVAGLAYPFSKLHLVRIDADACDTAALERFFDYAVTVLGEKFLKKNVSVDVSGNLALLPPTLIDTYTRLCK